MTGAAATTTEQLLQAVRVATGLTDLTWAAAPAPLSGGFWAEMYLVELTNAPAHLAGRLVARIMPDPTTAAAETAVQRHLHQCGYPVPAVRLGSGPTDALTRAWMLMDLAPGRPLLEGLSTSGAIRSAPAIYRRLPELLAIAAARLHRCPTPADHDPGNSVTAIDTFIDRFAQLAIDSARRDLAERARTLREHAPTARVVCHGDLHPYNVLVDGDAWTVIDWSTSVLADPHYDLGFTTLLLANPPLGGPAPVRAATRRIGRALSQRFLRAYEAASGAPVDPARLDWGQGVHAMRALVEAASWEAAGQLDAHRGHPWLTLRPVLEQQLRGRPNR